MHYAIFRKRQKSNEQPIYDDIGLTHYIADVAEYQGIIYNLENCENKTKFVISNLKQELSTSLHRQFLSQSTIPKVPRFRERRREEEGEHNMRKVKSF